jgi:hypothetical protein
MRRTSQEYCEHSSRFKPWLDARAIGPQNRGHRVAFPAICAIANHDLLRTWPKTRETAQQHEDLPSYSDRFVCFRSRSWRPGQSCAIPPVIVETGRHGGSSTGRYRQANSDTVAIDLRARCASDQPLLRAKRKRGMGISGRANSPHEGPWQKDREKKLTRIRLRLLFPDLLFLGIHPLVCQLMSRIPAFCGRVDSSGDRQSSCASG